MRSRVRSRWVSQRTAIELGCPDSTSIAVCSGQKPVELTLTLVSGFITEEPRKNLRLSAWASCIRSQMKHSLWLWIPSHTGMVSSWYLIPMLSAS